MSVYEDSDLDDEIWPGNKPVLKAHLVRVVVSLLVGAVLALGIASYFLR